MSDFIKINFKNGSAVVVNKSQIELTEDFDDTFFATTMQSSIFMGFSKNINGHIMQYQITREEYDRLCGELGIAGAKSVTELNHAFKTCYEQAPPGTPHICEETK